MFVTCPTVVRRGKCWSLPEKNQEEAANWGSCGVEQTGHLENNITLSISQRMNMMIMKLDDA